MSGERLNPRLAYLLARELDGDLTRVEKDELERLSLLEPRARRDRAGWIRVQKAMAPVGPPPRIATASLARKVMASAERRPLRRPWQGWLLAFAASSASLALGVFWIERREPMPEPIYAAERHAAPPVEVDLELSAKDTEGSALVQVRF